MASVLTKELFMKISNGDKDAFYQLYQETSTAVFGFLLSIVQSKEDAEDLLQETYIKVRINAHLYKEQGKPLAWIFTIARNLAFMKLRERKRSSLQEIEELDLISTFSEVENVEDRIVLKAAFQVLDQEEREIVILHAVSGWQESGCTGKRRHGIFDDLFAKYTSYAELVKVKTTNLGSMYELEYHIVLKDPRLEREMIDAIRTRNGNLNIVCGKMNFGKEEL